MRQVEFCLSVLLPNLFHIPLIRPAPSPPTSHSSSPPLLSPGLRDAPPKPSPSSRRHPLPLPAPVKNPCQQCRQIQYPHPASENKSRNNPKEWISILLPIPPRSPPVSPCAFSGKKFPLPSPEPQPQFTTPSPSSGHIPAPPLLEAHSGLAVPAPRSFALLKLPPQIP